MLALRPLGDEAAGRAPHGREMPPGPRPRRAPGRAPRAEREAVGDASEAVVELGQRGLVRAGDERDERLVREMREIPRHRRRRCRGLSANANTAIKRIRAWIASAARRTDRFGRTERGPARVRRRAVERTRKERRAWREKAALAALGLARGGCARRRPARPRGPVLPRPTAASHREAPLISEDPTADVTDFYLFSSPDEPGHGDGDHGRQPVRGAVRRPELVRLLAVREVRRSTSTTRATAGRTSVRVQVQDRGTRRCRTRSRSAASAASARATTSGACQGGKGSSIGKNLPVAPNNIGPRRGERSRAGRATSRSAIARSRIVQGRRPASSPAPPTTRSSATSARPSTR